MSDANGQAGRARHDAWRYGIAALLIYSTLSVLFFGRALLHGFSSFYIGNGPDPLLSMWFLEWWAHALTARLNPLMTHLVWAPGGFNLAWTTNISVAACLMLPFTRWLGPVASYNLLCLLCPAIAGLAAFALCKRVTYHFASALLGGFVFGFSPYMACKMLANVDLALVAIPPLAAYLAVRELERSIRRRTFVSLLTIVLVLQILLFLEVFATMTLSAAIAIILALLIMDDDRRARVRGLIQPIVNSYTLAFIITAPYFYYLFAFGAPHGGVQSASVDLLNFLIPVPMNALGTLNVVRAVTDKFRAGVYDCDGYLGLTLVAAIAMGWRHWREPVVRLLIIFAAVIGILAMGPRLQIVGHITIPMPWLFAQNMPLFDKAIEARLTVYMFLALAVLCAMWLSTGIYGRRWRNNFARGVAAALIVASLLPNLSASFWATRLDTPFFFSKKLYRRYLKPGEIVLVLPYGYEGDGNLWQALSGMYFKMAGGYVGLLPAIPEEYARWPVSYALYNIVRIPGASDQFKAFLKSHKVGAIIFASQGSHFIQATRHGVMAGFWVRESIPPRERSIWAALLDGLGVKPLQVGGITLYNLPSTTRAKWPDIDPVRLQQRMAAAQFPVLLRAADRYMTSKRNPARLTPLTAQQAGLLPPDWVGGPAVTAVYNPGIFLDNLLLGPWGQGFVAVGIEASYPAVKPLIENYGPDASIVYFPFPQRFSAPPPKSAERNPALMMMVFSRDGLAHAAERAAPAVAGN